METETALMTIILPVTYLVVDLCKPIPRVPDWALPIIAAVVGTVLGLLWAWTQGNTTGENLLLYGIVGFSFGAGATGINQVKRQAEERRTE